MGLRDFLSSLFGPAAPAPSSLLNTAVAWQPPARRPFLIHDYFGCWNHGISCMFDDDGNFVEVPDLLDELVHPSPGVRDFALKFVSSLAGRIHPTKLPQFESHVRSLPYRSRPWSRSGVADIVGRNYNAVIWGLFSIHPDGRMREHAVRELVKSDDQTVAIRFLLLRLNDWVEPVREIAESSVRARISPRYLDQWIPNLGIINKLQDRSRSDHSWLFTALAELFMYPFARAALMKALNSPDRSIARWAAACAMRADDGEIAPLIHTALDHDDALVRRFAAHRVQQWAECPERGRAIARMHRDTNMIVRRDALVASLELEPHARKTRLVHALYDHHPTIRQYARYYLAKFASEEGTTFDPQIEYLRVLAEAGANPPIGAVAGLGECGKPEDADAIAPFIHSNKTPLARTALKAVAQLDLERFIGELVTRLSDPRVSLARAASDGLMRRPGMVPAHQLLPLLTNPPFSHSGCLSLKVLCRLHGYDAIPFAVAAFGSSDKSTHELADQFLRSVKLRCHPIGPTEAQTAATRLAIEALPDALREPMYCRLRSYMRLGS